MCSALRAGGGTGSVLLILGLFAFVLPGFVDGKCGPGAPCANNGTCEV